MIMPNIAIFIFYIYSTFAKKLLLSRKLDLHSFATILLNVSDMLFQVAE